MNHSKFQIEITRMFLGVILVGILIAGNNVQARCRWVWKGIDSYYVCDDDQELRKGISICDFSTVRDRKGTPKTITVFCRADGSPWKEIIVGPRQVTMKLLRRDGSVEQQKQIFSPICDVPPFPGAK